MLIFRMLTSSDVDECRTWIWVWIWVLPALPRRSNGCYIQRCFFFLVENCESLVVRVSSSFSYFLRKAIYILHVIQSRKRQTFLYLSAPLGMVVVQLSIIISHWKWPYGHLTSTNGCNTVIHKLWSSLLFTLFLTVKHAKLFNSGIHRNKECYTCRIEWASYMCWNVLKSTSNWRF